MEGLCPGSGLQADDEDGREAQSWLCVEEAAVACGGGAGSGGGAAQAELREWQPELQKSSTPVAQALNNTGQIKATVRRHHTRTGEATVLALARTEAGLELKLFCSMSSRYNIDAMP